jgi:TonB family protein
MLDLNDRPTAPSNGRTGSRSKQPRRLLLALLLLVVAFAAVIARDHDFWFGSDQSSDLDSTEPETSAPAATPDQSAPTAQPVTKSAPAQTAQTSATPAAAPKKHLAVTKLPVVPKAVPESKPATSTQTASAAAPAVTANRTAVAPLDVEVVAGDTHKTIRPGSNALKVEILKPAHSAFAPATSAAEHAPVAGPTSAQLSMTAAYPALAQQMRVQGSVVLQAFIGADGVIENLRVLSGPAILATAAQQAVREWHFKPYLQNGQPVETQATITVNFTIRVGDSSPKVS